jgi:hypothetical protein
VDTVCLQLGDGIGGVMFWNCCKGLIVRRLSALLNAGPSAIGMAASYLDKMALAQIFLSLIPTA